MSIVEKTTDRTLDSSVLSLGANLNNRIGQLDDRDKLNSFFVVESMVETIIAKVEHIKFMEEIERKVKPYVILDTTE